MHGLGEPTRLHRAAPCCVRQTVQVMSRPAPQAGFRLPTNGTHPRRCAGFARAHHLPCAGSPPPEAFRHEASDSTEVQWSKGWGTLHAHRPRPCGMR